MKVSIIQPFNIVYWEDDPPFAGRMLVDFIWNNASYNKTDCYWMVLE